MADKPSASRREALQFFSGAAVSTVGINAVEQVSAENVEISVNKESGNEEWVVRLPDPAAQEVDSARDLQNKVSSQQTNVVATLETTDGVNVLQTLWITNAIIVGIDNKKINPKKDLKDIADAETVHPNFKVSRPKPDSDNVTALNHGTTTYGVDQVNAPEVWETFNTRGEGARVAVLDTGADPSHPDIELADDGWQSFDAEGNRVDSDPNDRESHGTHVSGTATGGSESGFHIGVAPDAELYAGKALGDDGSGTFARIIAAMQWAVENDADVMNMSLGATGFFNALINPVRNAIALGTFVVTSAGNSGEGSSGSPGNIYDSFAIGATNINKGIASFSSGEQVNTSQDWGTDAPGDWPRFYTVPDTSAPGVDVVSALPGGGYGTKSGTSMAAPHVTGIVALIRSSDSSIGAQQIENLLSSTAIHPNGDPKDIRYGRGITDAFRSVTRTETDSQIIGTVTRNGEPVQGISVTSTYGTRDVTDSNGEFDLPIESGQVTVEANQFGLASEPTTISADGLTEVNLSVEPTVDVILQAEQRPEVAATSLTESGEFAQFSSILSVANLEEYQVNIVSDNGIGGEDVSLSVIDGQTESLLGQVQPGGEGLSFQSALTGQIIVQGTVSDSISDGAQFTLEHTFSGQNRSISAQTGPTTVLQNPSPPSFEIISSNLSSTVGAGRTVNAGATVRNTGDLTQTQTVEYTVSLPNFDAGIPSQTTLTPGEETQVFGPLAFPDVQAYGGSGSHGIATNDDRAISSLEYLIADPEPVNVSATDSLTAGETLEAEVTLNNSGSLDTTVPVTLSLTGSQLASETTLVGQNVSVPGGDQVTQTITAELTGLVPGDYTVRAEAAGVVVEDSISISESEAPVIVDAPATDPDGDGLYEDIDGNGVFDVRDIQAFLETYDTTEVTRNSDLFDFDQNGEVTLRDVQALLNELN